MAGTDLRHVAGTSREQLTPAQPGPMSTIARSTGGQQDFLGLFVQDLYAPAEFIEVSAAVRADWWRNRDGRRQLLRMDGGAGDDRFDDRAAGELSPRLGVLVRPSARTRVRGTAYRAFRAPNLNELYRPFQVGTVLTGANESLRSERLSGAELGVEGLWPSVGSLRIAGFASTLTDPIANVTLAAPAPDGTTRQRQNLGRVTSRGVDVAADGRLPLGLIVSAALHAGALPGQRGPRPARSGVPGHPPRPTPSGPPGAGLVVA